MFLSVFFFPSSWLMVFVSILQWPGSYCDTMTSCCYPTTGKPAADFGIHGLWPNYNDGTYPKNCDASSPYDPKKVVFALEIIARKLSFFVLVLYTRNIKVFFYLFSKWDFKFYKSLLTGTLHEKITSSSSLQQQFGRNFSSFHFITNISCDW